MKLEHGARVKYIGRTDRDFGLTNGQIYTNCGLYPQPPMQGWKDRDEVSVYTADPEDSFGGVVSRPACEFEPAAIDKL